jgi:hypothetical protein
MRLSAPPLICALIRRVLAGSTVVGIMRACRHVGLAHRRDERGRRSLSTAFSTEGKA